MDCASFDLKLSHAGEEIVSDLVFQSPHQQHPEAYCLAQTLELKVHVVGPVFETG